MKNKIAFLAVGQAGGNIGQLFEEQGFSVLYINTSMEDLRTLSSAKHKYHITGGEGCNKDRHKAKQLVIDDFDKIAAEIDSKINASIIFVIFAAGGGTGSGAGPMLMDLLIDEGRTIGAVTILPDKTESVKAHMNAYECFTELVAIENSAACFVIDNSKGDKLSLNHPFSDALTSFIQIPENHSSVQGNIDQAEIEETLKSHGMAIVIESDNSSGASFISSLNDSIFAAKESDRAVKYITVSLSGEVSLEDIKKAVGEPLDSFVTYNTELTICCFAGLNFPHERLEEIYQRVDQSKDAILKNLNVTKDLKLRNDINFLSSPNSPNSPKSDKGVAKKTQSRRDILNKYL